MSTSVSCIIKPLAIMKRTQSCLVTNRRAHRPPGKPLYVISASGCFAWGHRVAWYPTRLGVLWPAFKSPWPHLLCLSTLIQSWRTLSWETRFCFRCRLRGAEMPKKLAINWTRTDPTGFDDALKRYRRYLKERGLRDSTIEEYAGNAGRYLRFAKKSRPSIGDCESFRNSLHEWKLSRSTLNQYSYAIKAYHKINMHRRIRHDNSL